MSENLNVPDAVLVRIKHKILQGLGIDSTALKLIIDNYVNKHITTTSTDRQRAKVNLYNEFTNNKLTIKGFFKLLKVLNVEEVEFKVTIKTKRKIAVSVKERILMFAEENNDEQ